MQLPTTIGALSSSSMMTRHPLNPLLTKDQVPYAPALVFNAGVTKYEGQYVMVFRNDYGHVDRHELEPQHTTDLGLAFSKDGIHWDVSPKPILKLYDEEINRVYDPRLTVIDGICYMCFAVDTQHGIRGGIASTEDFHTFKMISMTTPDNRNMVLFPEKINGKFTRLERPFTVYGRGGVDRFDIWMSNSPDLVYWGNSQLLL